MATAIRSLSASRALLPVRWPMAALLALVITYADGFWMTALQGTIGAIERSEPPFTRWLRDATTMLPLVFLAIVFALFSLRHLISNRRRALLRFGAITLVIALIGGGVGLIEAGISAVYDYQIQAQHVVRMFAYGAPGQDDTYAIASITAESSPAYALYCNLRGVAAKNAISLLQYATFLAHVRALSFFSVLLLLTNLLLVGGLLALLPSRVWAAR